MSDSTYYQKQKDKNNNLINSSLNNNIKGPIIYKNSYNNYNIKTSIQPNTPIAFSQSKISPEKLNEKIKSIQINELIQNNVNKSEKNIPSKSLEKERIKKLIYNQNNQSKTKNNIKYKKKVDIIEEKKIPNLIKPFELVLEKPSLSSRETKLNSQNKNRNKVLNINKNSKNNNNIIIISNKDINDSNANNKNNNLNLNKNYNNILNNKNNVRNNKNIKTNDSKNVGNDSNKNSSKVDNSIEKNKTLFNKIKNNVQIDSNKSDTLVNSKNNTLNNSRKENLTKKIVNLKENNNNIRNINFNISLKPLLQEHMKNQINEAKTKERGGRNLTNEKQKKKPMIQGIKILDSNGIKNLDVIQSKKYNKILPKNKIIEISKKSTSHNKDNNDNKDHKDNKESKENKNSNNNKLIIRKENSERINDKNKYYKENKNTKNNNNNNIDSKQVLNLIIKIIILV
jgi:hypothetical protein